ncbi:MAG: hypothetical protein CMP59_00580 [Flavobacteriales bacterium]|nr:hypothetical protein [Flavobacteriales bacterium]|tara:strand:- start:876 stop:1538 length:663 start_codon:yes stop_codon:yes gene_type:complete
MAKYRNVHTSFWSDPFIGKLNLQQTVFYLYLLTNERSKQCGITEISIRQMMFDVKLSENEIVGLIEFFEKEDKIKFNQKTSEIALRNWPKYNSSASPKVKACIDKELKDVKDTSLIEYIYSIDTQSQQEETKKNKEKKDVPYREFKHLVISKEEFDKLEEKFSKEEIDDILDQIENYKDNDKYTSLYLTANNWLKKNHPERKENPVSQTPEQKIKQVLHI